MEKSEGFGFAKNREVERMNIKDTIAKIGEMDPKHLALIIECGIILSKLEQHDQDKLMELLDAMTESYKKKIREITAKTEKSKEKKT